MQITISKSILAGALSELAPLAGKNKVLPILSYIKVVTKGNRIRLQATDAETTIRKYVEAESIDQDCEFLVECAGLNAFINKIKSDTLKLTLDGSTLTVKHSKGKASFQTLSAEDFVEVKQDDNAVEFSLPASKFAEFISIAKNFVGFDDYRPQMKPIRALIEDGTLTVCATDNRKMFVDSVDVVGEIPDVQWFIEPSVFVFVANACKGADFVSIKASKNSVSYRIRATTIFSKQTQGKYPDFRRVIPKEHLIDVEFNKTEAIDAIQRALLFTEDSRMIQIGVTSMAIEVKGENLTKLSKAAETFTCSSNADIIFGANASSFLDGLKACETTNIKMELYDASRPIVFKDADNTRRVAIVMPMIVGKV